MSMGKNGKKGERDIYSHGRRDAAIIFKCSQDRLGKVVLGCEGACALW
jgi:hypothetical protein